MNEARQRRNRMATREIGMTGCAVIDREAHRVGTVSDVVYDDRTLEMRWAVVEYGLIHHRTLVPASKLYKSPDGSVVTTLDKHVITHAPRLHGDIPSTSECQQYYGRDA